MMERIAEGSPRFKARIAGVFYLLVFLTGGVATFVNGRLIVSGDAAAMANSILENELAVRLSFAGHALMVASYLTVTALFYDLFRPVNKNLSLLAAFFSLVGCTILGVSSVFLLAPLGVLRGTYALSGFTVEQLQALAFMLFKLQPQGFNTSLIFFGFYCLLIGYLIFKSTFLPRILGVLMAFAGLGWLTFLSPPLVHFLSPYILVPGVVGEGALTLWLLLFGVNVQKWQEKASDWQVHGA